MQSILDILANLILDTYHEKYQNQEVFKTFI